MRLTDHLSDDVLKQIIENDDFETQESGIETHISDCAMCQARLEDLADHAWMEKHRDNLARNYDSVCNSGSSLAGSLNNGTAAANSKNAVKSRDFELMAIEKMISEIALPPTHPETLGRLGGYELESVIGFGGMGVVLRAHDHVLQRPVAIKLIIPRLANDGTTKQRFAREARAAAAILHPNVIAIHGIDETKSIPWFVMPLVNGPSLRELVEQQGPLNERDIVRIGLQIASGLAAAHSHGVIHRDIKPENILVDNQVNRVVITDFGLARQEFDATLTGTGILAGTLNYMSPEQARGKDLDARSDLFSLGAVLYFLATGVAPFRADSVGGVIHNVISERPKDVRILNPEISHPLSRTIDALLAKDPGSRFQSATELEDFFANMVSHLNQPTSFKLPRLPQQKRFGLSSLIVAAAALIVLAITILIAWSGLSNTQSNSPQELWTQIQQTHQLESPQNFAQQLGQLESSVNRLNRQSSISQALDDDGLNNEILQLETEIKKLSQQMDFGG